MGPQGGLHRGPARRHLVQNADVQVAVERHREGARNRRRGHHQDVRTSVVTLEQRHALTHTEPVLLVDHHQPEGTVPNRVLDQGVRADHDRGLSRGHRPQRLASLRGTQATRQELDLHVERGQERLDAARVLFGEDLGRRHQHRLRPSLDGQGHGEGRHRGLPRADVALEKAVHAPLRLHVGVDLAKRPRLGLRERKGQGLV